ncbi:MAG TPA: hypothetical protein VFI10_04725 [Gaiellaceae bacterium]|jgi:hypothetical protein|nr:hypothetical protein [Gaiellaceae bacterium]
MDNVLGLIAFIVYITAVVSTAAGITWVVVRVTPKKAPKPDAPADG